MNINRLVKRTKFVRSFKRITYKSGRMLSVVMLLFLVQLFVVQRVNAQEKRVTLHVVNQPLSVVLSELSKQTDYKFFYSDNVTNVNQKVTLHVANKPLNEVLVQLFKDTEIGFQFKNNQILLFKKNKHVSVPVASSPVSSNFIRVTGKVTDEKGQPFPGVTIVAQGVRTGTITDADGNYSFDKIAPNATLVFSFMGMQEQLVPVDNKAKIDVMLREKATALNEVVVVGFGTQKKVNVTGAITTVSGGEILKNPVGNISNALIGSGSGISGLQSSGEAGQNTDRIYIRGQATYGNSQPLIVIDGIEQPTEQAFSEFNNIDPNEIAGISVLKDAASTAVYGIRGANGVIIVTTKRGKEGKPVFNLSVNYGLTHPFNLLKTASSYEWALSRNQAVNTINNDFGTPSYNYLLFSEDQLWKMQHNRDYTPAEVAAMTNLTPDQQAQLNASPALIYGSNDISTQLFDHTGPQKNINLNVSGGNAQLKYFASVGYFTQLGIGPNISYYGDNTKSTFDRYNFKANFDLHVIKNTDISINMTGQFTNQSGFGANDKVGFGNPSSTNDISTRYEKFGHFIMVGNPLVLPGIIDGKLVESVAGFSGSSSNPLGAQEVYKTSMNAIASLIESGVGTLANTLIDNTIKINHKMDYLTKGLSIRATAQYQNNFSNYITETFSVPTYSVQRDPVNPLNLNFFGGGMSNNTFSNASNSTWNKMYFDAGINYNRTFGNHSVTALLLGKASEYTMPNDAFNTSSGLMGLVGRVTYNYQDRYMLEYDLGYDGTEQFAPNQRYGYFPAYSIGWVPTNETFFHENKWVTFLKIRGSYGEVGNDMLSGRRYLYLPNTYFMNVNNANSSNQARPGYYFGNSNGSNKNAYYPGAIEGTLGNPDVTWERAKKMDIGFDSRFFSDRLSLTADYFNEIRNDILTTLGIIPVTFGVLASNVPPANVGKTLNRGYEISLGWKDKIGQVGYSIHADVSYAKNKILYMSEVPNPYPWMNHTGYSIGQNFGLISDGFFNTPQELANRPFNTFNTNVATLGDLRYKDLNGDGIIDNKDIAPIGYPNLPEYHFSATLGLNYKGFYANVLIIGTANGSFSLPNWLTVPFGTYNCGNLYQWQIDDQWTAAKAASGAPISYPRFAMAGSPGANTYTTASDFWLKSSDFVRIKNLEVGYSFQSRLLKHLQINRLRLYFNTNNLFTFKNALTQYGIDPEQKQTGDFLYPFTRTYNFGMNIEF